MYHGGNQHCIGFALPESVSEVFDFAPAAGSDDWHGDSFRNHPGYGQFIAVADSVGINGIDSQQKNILEMAYGGAQPNISGEKICGLLFPLPPLAEQRRIVQTIEQYNSILEAISK